MKAGTVGAALLLLFLCACNEPAEDPRALALAAEADEALRIRDYHTALVLADSSLELGGHLADAQFVRGRVYFELGQMARSQEAYESVLAKQPDYPGAHHNLGNALFGQQKYRAALEHFKLEAVAKRAPRPWHAAAATFVQLAMPDSARAAYQYALRLDSAYAPAHAGLAELSEQEGDFGQALRHAERALALAPDHGQYHYLAGLMLTRLERFEEALALLERAIHLRPWDYSAAYTLGQALQQLGREDKARQWLSQANASRAEQQRIARLGSDARAMPTNFMHQVNYADALRNAGRLSEAVDMYLIALALRPQNPDLRNNLATAYMQQGDTTRALNEYRAVLSRDSTNAVAWLNIGWHLARTNRMRQAVRAWGAAARHHPGHPGVLALRELLQRTDSTRHASPN